VSKRTLLVPAALAALFLAGVAACVYAGISDPLFSAANFKCTFCSEETPAVQPASCPASECTASPVDCPTCPDCPWCPDCCPAAGATAKVKIGGCPDKTACPATSADSQ
jgi:hypothetical protein